MRRFHNLDLVATQPYPLANQTDIKAIEEVPFEKRMPFQSTFEALEYAASINPEKPALLFLQTGELDEEAIPISFRGFIHKIRQAVNMFQDLGLGPEDTVSFMLPLLPQAYFTLWAGETAGITNPINPFLESEHIAGILKAAKTKILVALGPTPGIDIWEKVEQIRGDLPDLKVILQVGGPGNPKEGIYPFDDTIEKYPGDHLTNPREIKLTDTAAFFHTGGTTGTPKLARHTQKNQLFQAWLLGTIISYNPETTAMNGLPLFHVGGALNLTLFPLTMGNTIVILTPSGYRNQAVGRNYWQLAEKYRVGAVSVVPTVLSMFLNAPTEGLDLSSIEYVGAGGSAIPVEVCNALDKKLGVKVLEVYGMTETSSVFTCAPKDAPTRYGSVGLPGPYCDLRIVKLDNEGKLERDCETNEIGVVIMKGPGVFPGYVKPEQNKNAFVDGDYINSGDLGRVDEDGYLWITGRAKDLIIRGAHNIDPIIIEEPFYQHPDVQLAAAIGKPDGYAGELPVVFVQLKPGKTPNEKDLSDFIRPKIPERAAIPTQIYFIETMPLTLVGKIFKPQLRWDATKMVFSEILSPLENNGVKVEVEVGPNPVAGTIAIIKLTGESSVNREEVGEQIKEILSPFTVKSEVSWN